MKSTREGTERPPHGHRHGRNGHGHGHGHGHTHIPRKSEKSPPSRAEQDYDAREPPDNAEVSTPKHMLLDELRCELLCELLEAILLRTIEDINSGFGGQVASSLDLTSSSPLTIENVEKNAMLVESRNAVAASILTGVSCLELMSGQHRVVLWSALIKVLSYRLPMIQPFHLHRILQGGKVDQDFTDPKSLLDGRHQAITMMKIIMQLGEAYKRFLAGLVVVLDVSCFCSDSLAKNAIDMLSPAIFPSIFLAKDREVTTGDPIMTGRSIYAQLAEAAGVCLCVLQDQFISRNPLFLETLGIADKGGYLSPLDDPNALKSALGLYLKLNKAGRTHSAGDIEEDSDGEAQGGKGVVGGELGPRMALGSSIDLEEKRTRIPQGFPLGSDAKSAPSPAISRDFGQGLSRPSAALDAPRVSIDGVTSLVRGLPPPSLSKTDESLIASLSGGLGGICVRDSTDPAHLEYKSSFAMGREGARDLLRESATSLRSSYGDADVAGLGDIDSVSVELVQKYFRKCVVLSEPSVQADGKDEDEGSTEIPMSTRADKSSLVRYLRWSAGVPELAVRILNYRSSGKRLRDSISWGSVLSLARTRSSPGAGSTSPVPAGFLDLSVAQMDAHQGAPQASYSSQGLEELIDMVPPTDDVPVRTQTEGPSAGLRILRDAAHAVEEAEGNAGSHHASSEPKITYITGSHSLATSTITDAILSNISAHASKPATHEQSVAVNDAENKLSPATKHTPAGHSPLRSTSLASDHLSASGELSGLDLSSDDEEVTKNHESERGRGRRGKHHDTRSSSRSLSRSESRSRSRGRSLSVSDDGRGRSGSPQVQSLSPGRHRRSPDRVKRRRDKVPRGLVLHHVPAQVAQTHSVNSTIVADDVPPSAESPFAKPQEKEEEEKDARSQPDKPPRTRAASKGSLVAAMHMPRVTVAASADDEEEDESDEDESKEDKVVKKEDEKEATPALQPAAPRRPAKPVKKATSVSAPAPVEVAEFIPETKPETEIEQEPAPTLAVPPSPEPESEPESEPGPAQRARAEVLQEALREASIKEEAKQLEEREIAMRELEQEKPLKPKPAVEPDIKKAAAKVEVKSKPAAKSEKPVNPSKPEKPQKPEKPPRNKLPGRTTLASGLSQMPPNLSRSALDPIVKKIKDGPGLSPSASAGSSPRSPQPDGKDKVLYDANDGTGFARLLREGLLRHSQERSGNAPGDVYGPPSPVPAATTPRELPDEGEYVPPATRLNAVLSRARERRGNPCWTNRDPGDEEVSEFDVARSVEIMGTASNRLATLLMAADEEESPAFDTDSMRRREIRRIKVLKKQRKRRRLREAGSSTHPLLRLSSGMNMSASLAGAAAASAAMQKLRSSGRAGFNASLSKGLDQSQQRRSRYLLGLEDHRLTIRRVPAAFVKVLQRPPGTTEDSAEPAPVHANAEVIEPADPHGALLELTRAAMIKGIGTRALNLINGVVHGGWVNRKTSTGLWVQRFLVLCCDDWPSVKVALKKRHTSSPHKGDLSDEEQVALKAAASLTLQLYESATPTLWGDAPLTLKARTRMDHVIHLKTATEEAKGSRTEPPRDTPAGPAASNMDYSRGKSDPHNFSIRFKMLRTVKGINHFGSEGSSHSVTQSSKSVEEWHFRCEDEHESMLWTRLLHTALHIVHHPTLPGHTAAAVPFNSQTDEMGQLALKLGLKTSLDFDINVDEDANDSDYDDDLEEKFAALDRGDAEYDLIDRNKSNYNAGAF